MPTAAAVTGKAAPARLAAILRHKLKAQMKVVLPDNYGLFVVEHGSGLPLIVLHGGPGADHTMFRPYLDALGNEYRVLYVDERGQGRSDRVDPTTLSLEVFARDVDLLAEALGLDEFALLGHSFGAIIATYHATELGTALAYIISAGGDSSYLPKERASSEENWLPAIVITFILLIFIFRILRAVGAFGK